MTATASPYISQVGTFQGPQGGKAPLSHVIPVDTSTASAVGTGFFLPPDSVLADVKVIVQDPTSNNVTVSVGHSTDTDAWSAAQSLNSRGVFTPGIGSGDRTNTGDVDGGPVEIVTDMSAVGTGTTAGKILVIVTYY